MFELSQRREWTSNNKKGLADRLSDKLPSSIVFIANIVAEGRFVSKNKIDKLHTRQTVDWRPILGGGGGGRKDFAQAGGRVQRASPGRQPSGYCRGTSMNTRLDLDRNAEMAINGKTATIATPLGTARIPEYDGGGA